MQTSDFPVLESGWTAQEEMALLEAVMDCGFGNWLVVCLSFSYNRSFQSHKFLCLPELNSLQLSITIVWSSAISKVILRTWVLLRNIKIEAQLTLKGIIIRV